MANTAAIVATLEQDAPEIDLAPIELIHRGDGSIGFMRKPETPRFKPNGEPIGMETLFSITRAELRETLPAVRHWLLKDTYFTINTYFRGLPYQMPTRAVGAAETGLPDVWRKENGLRYLNAIFADLDVGRTDPTEPPEKLLTFGKAVGMALDMMDAGELPPASIYARSGRGAYLFWLLRRDDHPTLPPRGDSKYYPEKLELYKAVGKAASAKLKHLAADTHTHDGSRICKVPGTIDRKSGRPTQYLIAADAQGRPYFYTLSELAECFGVTEAKTELPEATRFIISAPVVYGRAVKNKGAAPLRGNGFRIRNAKRAQDLMTLEQDLCNRTGHGWPSGFGWPRGRRRHLRLFAEFLKGAGEPWNEILRAVKTMAANCNPPYPSDPTDQSIMSLVTEVVQKPVPPYSTKKLCEWLDVTPDRARTLNLLTIVPPEVAAERKSARVANREIGRAHV